MKVLVIGGTRFVGGHLVEALLGAGHEVTLFHRGQTNPDRFVGRVSRIVGDRDVELSELANIGFDCVIDTCGYKPHQIERSATVPGLAKYYIFVSTISVYDPDSMPIMESSRLYSPQWDNSLAIDGETYGAFKVACELELAKHSANFENGVCVVRPGLIVGPGDHTDRFSYWIHRFDQGGEALVPDDEISTCQFLDVRDLANFIVHCCEQRTNGTMNAVGPSKPLQFADFIELVHQATGGKSEIARLSPSFLQAQGVQAWTELPLYSSFDSDDRFIDFVSHELGHQNGLSNREPMETIADTLLWLRDQRGAAPLKSGLTPEREKEVIECWKAGFGK